MCLCIDCHFVVHACELEDNGGWGTRVRPLKVCKIIFCTLTAEGQTPQPDTKTP